MKKVLVSILAICLTVAVGSAGASLAQAVGSPESTGQAAVGTAFTYQGNLVADGTPVSDDCDFEFRLYSTAGGDTQVGSTVTRSNETVSDGVFTVQLDFGSDAFTGDARHLDISVRCPAGSGSYTLLAPRQELTAVPYALHALSAWNLSGNGGTSPAANFLGTTDNQPLVIRTNGAEAVRVDATGQIGVGTGSNLHPGITVKSAAAAEHYGGYWLQDGDSDLAVAGLHLDGSNYLRLRMHTGTAWYDALTVANEAGMHGNIGVGIISPTAKLTIDSVGTDWSFGSNAVYVAEQNRYFDFEHGMVFRGSGPFWNARFTGSPTAGESSEIVGIYKREASAGDTRTYDQPPQGAIAVFRNSGEVEIGDTTFSADGNVGVGAGSPTAKLTVDNVGSDDSFGNSAVYVGAVNKYFDFSDGLMFRGEGNDWSARFTSTDDMDADGEIVGIYKEEVTPGETRNNAPSQGPIAVFRNDGSVGIGTNANLPTGLSIKTTDVSGWGHTALMFQGAGSTSAYAGLQLNANNDFTVRTYNGSSWNNDLIIEASSGYLGFGYGMTDPAHLIHLNGGAYSDGIEWVDGSSREYKSDIQPLTLAQAQETLAGLDPVTFRYKADEDGELQAGFIAEDVPELVATADRKGLGSMDIVAVLARVVQDQQERLAAQDAQIASQQECIDDLEERLTALEYAANTSESPPAAAGFPITWMLLAGLPVVGLVAGLRRRAGERR